MNTLSQPATQPFVPKYMYCAIDPGAPEPTQAMPEPLKLPPFIRSATRSAPTLVRIVSMPPKTAALKLPEDGEMWLSAVALSVASL